MSLAFWLSAWILASVPWCNSKRFGVWGWWTQRQSLNHPKPVWLTCLESVLLYSLAFLLMFVMESQQGQPTSQLWQFWVIAACLWIVLAFPAAAWFKLRR